MNGLTGLSRFARHTLTFALHFVHGGFVMVGVIVIGAFGFLATQHGTEGLNPRQLFGEYFGSAASVVPVSGEDSESAMESELSDDGLSPAQKRVVLAIAKRHKVAPVMVEALMKTVDKEARANDLDPLLVLAIVTVESGFNPFAESVFGAQGLMQVIPKYHQDKISADKGVAALFDPAENIRVGSRIVREYLRATGNLEMALQLYGGAANDPEMNYAQRVLGEQERLKQIANSGKGRVMSSRPVASPAG